MSMAEGPQPKNRRGRLRKIGVLRRATIVAAQVPTPRLVSPTRASCYFQHQDASSRSTPPATRRGAPSRDPILAACRRSAVAPRPTSLFHPYRLGTRAWSSRNPNPVGNLAATGPALSGPPELVLSLSRSQDSRRGSREDFSQPRRSQHRQPLRPPPPRERAAQHPTRVANPHSAPPRQALCFCCRYR